MRKTLNTLVAIGAISGAYFLLGSVMHWTGNTVAVCVSGLCFSGGVFIRVLEV